MSYLTMPLLGMIIKMYRIQLASLLTNEKRSIFWPIGNSHSMFTIVSHLDCLYNDMS
jgi:hypothetical protein